MILSEHKMGAERIRTLWIKELKPQVSNSLFTIKIEIFVE